MENKQEISALFLFVIGLYIFWPVTPAYAQATSNVQVDLSVLDTMERQVRRREPAAWTLDKITAPKKGPTTPRFNVETIKITSPTKVTATQKMPLIVQAPTPKRKPAQKIVQPPTPKKRPVTSHASESFIKQARIDYAASQLSKPAIKKPKKTIPSTPTKATVEVKTDTILNPDDILPRTTTETTTPNNPEQAQAEKNITADLEDLIVVTNAQKILKSIKTPTIAPERDVIEQENNSAPEIDTPLGKYIRLEFVSGERELTPEIESILKQDVVGRLSKSPELRIEIQSFATPADQGQSSARRASLSRAVNIRSYLIDNNIEPKRIDIRALGEETVLEPIDRADLFFIKDGEHL